MGKTKPKDTQEAKSKRGRFHEKHDKKSLKARTKKPATFNAEKFLQVLSKKIKAKSPLSKPKKLPLNFALPPKCTFLVETPSPDPSVAYLEGPGVSIRLPIIKDSTAGQIRKTIKGAPKLVKAQKKTH